MFEGAALVSLPPLRLRGDGPRGSVRPRTVRKLATALVVKPSEPVKASVSDPHR